MRLLLQGDLGLCFYLYLFHYAYIFNSLGICAQVLYDVPICSFPGGYVHKSYTLTLLDWCVAHACIFNSHKIYARVALVFWPMRESRVKNPLGMMKDSLGSMICWEVSMTHGGVFLAYSLLGMGTCWEACRWLWPMRNSLVMCGPLGKFFFFFMAHWETCVDSTHEGGLVCSLGKFLHSSWGGCLCVSDLRGSPSMIPYFAKDLVDDLNSRGSFLGNFRSTKGCFRCFPFIRDALGVLVSFTQLPNWGYLYHLGAFLEFSFPIFYLLGT